MDLQDIALFIFSDSKREMSIDPHLVNEKKGLPSRTGMP